MARMYAVFQEDMPQAVLAVTTNKKNYLGYVREDDPDGVKVIEASVSFW